MSPDNGVEHRHTTNNQLDRSIARNVDQATIDEKRRLRQQKREQKELLASDAAAPLLNEHGFKTSFIKRDWLQVEHAGSDFVGGSTATKRTLGRNVKAVQFTVMTYNLLAQCLVRRKLFPTSGEALKWKNRRGQLLAELSAHNASIMCLQEVGKDMLRPVLHDFFQASGYSYEFHCGPQKQHGILIAWRTQFELCHTSRLDYDQYKDSASTNGEIGSSYTKNVGLICVLADRSSSLKVTIATTHLFWHPKGTCERARQSSLLIESASIVDEQYGQGRIILGGDFNTEPNDPTYEAMTRRPFHLDDRGLQIMTESAKHKSFADEEEGEEESWVQEKLEVGVDHATRESQGPDERWRTFLNTLSEGPQLSSLYSKHLRSVSPSHATTNGEPECTNYANVYRGTLDYIFLMGRSSSSLTCTGLLDIPDISKLTNGLPQEGQFPSDHFCLMCELSVHEEDMSEESDGITR